MYSKITAITERAPAAAPRLPLRAVLRTIGGAGKLLHCALGLFRPSAPMQQEGGKQTAASGRPAVQSRRPEAQVLQKTGNPYSPAAALLSAEMIRQSALADTKKGKYRSAYRKILEAAALHSFSASIAEDRRRIAAMYRNRLDTYLYCMLVPQVPLFIVVRQLMALQQQAQAGRFSQGDVLTGLLLLHYAVTFSIVGRIGLVRKSVQ